MQRPIILGAIAISTAMSAGEIITLNDVILDGFQPVPPTGSLGTGVATVIVNTDTRDISINGSFSGMEGIIFAGHIHGPADIGQNSPIVIFPLEIVSEDGFSGTFSLEGRLGPSHLDAFMDSRIYLNLHSTEFRDGEIRGQIIVPGPAGVGLFGVAGLVGIRRRRRSDSVYKPSFSER